MALCPDNAISQHRHGYSRWAAGLERRRRRSIYTDSFAMLEDVLRANVALTSEYRMRAINQFVPAGFSLVSHRSARTPLAFTAAQILDDHARLPSCDWTACLASAIFASRHYEYERSLQQVRLSLWFCARALLEAVSIRRCPCP
jgi:hypothetical protein